ncbi:MAG: hypothetical protein KF716_14845 [Anaerolineae bacterium]|nr:hypothetical protein [Anaerolineae bacterium]
MDNSDWQRNVMGFIHSRERICGVSIADIESECLRLNFSRSGTVDTVVNYPDIQRLNLFLTALKNHGLVAYSVGNVSTRSSINVHIEIPKNWIPPEYT